MGSPRRTASEPAASPRVILAGLMSIHSRTVAIIRVGAAASCVFGASISLAAEGVSGVPRIVDGDTVEIGQAKIRLSGIDAPETDQICLDAKAQTWACGIAARDELIRFLSPAGATQLRTDQHDERSRRAMVLQRG
jgi:endonuclease YncB( thermonuclease family)